MASKGIKQTYPTKRIGSNEGNSCQKGGYCLPSREKTGCYSGCEHERKTWSNWLVETNDHNWFYEMVEAN